MTTRPGRRWWRWQIGLRSTIVLVSSAALGLNLVRERSRMPMLWQQLESLQNTQPAKLPTANPSQVATLPNEQLRMEEMSWQVDLPPGGRYRLCMATRVGVALDDRPLHVASVPIEPGQHILSTDWQRIGTGWRVVATWNLVDRLALDETGDWLDQTSFYGWSGMVPGRRSVPLGGPVLLAYQRYHSGPTQVVLSSSGPAAEVPGLKLWIETEPAEPSPP